MLHCAYAFIYSILMKPHKKDVITNYNAGIGHSPSKGAHVSGIGHPSAPGNPGHNNSAPIQFVGQWVTHSPAAPVGIGMQVSGIGQPLVAITGQLIMSSPHGAEGHVTAHSVPSVPVVPFVGMQVSGILQPLSVVNPGQCIMSLPQSMGHVTAHSFPSLPTGPPFIGRQLSGIGQPLLDTTGQVNMSWPHGAVGQFTAHSIPSVPTGPPFVGMQVSGI